MRHLKSSIFIIVSFISGSLISLFTTLAFAHGGNNDFVHGCVSTPLIPGTPNIRIVSATTGCNGGETALDWPKAASSSADLVCIACQPKDILHRINEPDFTDVNLDNAIMTNTNLRDENISGSSFVFAVVAGAVFSGGDGTDTDFTDANLSGSNIQSGADFTEAKFIRADMSYGSYDNSTFIDADFTNADLSNAYFSGSDVTGADFTGVTWNNTYCPDETNSNDNGNTCIGHLTP